MPSNETFDIDISDRFAPEAVRLERLDNTINKLRLIMERWDDPVRWRRSLYAQEG